MSGNFIEEIHILFLLTLTPAIEAAPERNSGIDDCSVAKVEFLKG
jgi:hypothetical protein